MADSTIHDRCKQWLIDTIAQGEPMSGPMFEADVDKLVAFVLAETARRAAPQFVGCAPLVLFFPDEKSRQELVRAFHVQHPDSKSIEVNP